MNWCMDPFISPITIIIYFWYSKWHISDQWEPLQTGSCHDLIILLVFPYFPAQQAVPDLLLSLGISQRALWFPIMEGGVYKLNIWRACARAHTHTIHFCTCVIKWVYADASNLNPTPQYLGLLSFSICRFLLEWWEIGSHDPPYLFALSPICHWSPYYSNCLFSQLPLWFPFFPIWTLSWPPGMLPALLFLSFHLCSPGTPLPPCPLPYTHPPASPIPPGFPAASAQRREVPPIWYTYNVSPSKDMQKEQQAW